MTTKKCATSEKWFQNTIQGSELAHPCRACAQRKLPHDLAASRRSATRKKDPFYYALFSIDWNPREFCKSQSFESETSLGEIVTLSGSALYAYVTTCAEYLRLFWPNTHGVLLPQLQIAMEEGESSNIFSDDTLLTVKFQTGILELHVHGSENLLIELA